MATRMNWSKSNDWKLMDKARRENDCFAGSRPRKTTKISNKQKTFIAKLIKERDIKWTNAINSFTRKQASDYIDQLLGKDK